MRVLLRSRVAAWFTGGTRRDTGDAAPVAAWRRRAGPVADTGSAADVEALLAERAALGLPDEDTEIDAERLQARLDLLALEDRLARHDLPEVQTQHKAIADERCRFIAPAVWCTAEGDLPGTLFVTDQRVRFAGGPGFALRWSAVGRVVARERDLLLAGTGTPRHLRCNAFSDARVAARLIEFLRTVPPDS